MVAEMAFSVIKFVLIMISYVTMLTTVATVRMSDLSDSVRVSSISFFLTYSNTALKGAATSAVL